MTELEGTDAGINLIPKMETPVGTGHLYATENALFLSSKQPYRLPKPSTAVATLLGYDGTCVLL